MIAATPEAPYYAVIFASGRRDAGPEAHDAASARMGELVGGQRGFLGFENARAEIGITVSYWSDLDAIRDWNDRSSISPRNMPAELTGTRPSRCGSRGWNAPTRSSSADRSQAGLGSSSSQIPAMTVTSSG